MSTFAKETVIANIMTTNRPDVVVRYLAPNKASICAAARTVSLSFAPDPLIQWLLRDTTKAGWETLNPELQRWQEARLREYTCRGITIEATTNESTSSQVGVCFLFPPKPLRRWLKPSWWPVYLRVLYEQHWLNLTESLADEEKVMVMMENHYASADSLKASYPPNSLYYLEIAAVSPDSQGLGVGGKLMRAVVDRIGDSPCFLECTNAKNVPFYEKYGFKTVTERELKYGTNSCTLYYMVRDIKDKTSSPVSAESNSTSSGAANPLDEVSLTEDEASEATSWRPVVVGMNSSYSRGLSIIDINGQKKLQFANDGEWTPETSSISTGIVEIPI